MELVDLVRSLSEAWTRITDAWAESSGREYQSRVHVVRRFCKALREKEQRQVEGMISEEEFIRFIDVLALAGREGSTFEGYRSALIWEALTSQPPSLEQVRMLRQEHVKMFVAAAAYGGGRPTRKGFVQRGALSVQKLLQLVQVCRLEKKEMYAFGFTVAFHFLLRHQELVALKYSDFKKHDVEGFLLFIECPKRRRRTNDARHGEWRSVLPDSEECAGKIIAQGTEGREGFLVDGWDKKTALRLVERTATLHFWNTKLQWDVHSLRHGGVILSLAERVEVAKIMSAGGWRRQTTLQNVYGKRGRDENHGN